MKQIIIRSKDWKLLTDSLFRNRDIESGVYATYKISTQNNSLKILIQNIICPEEKDYQNRTPSAVAFKPYFTESVFRECEKQSSHLLDIHTHPWSESVAFSHIDDREAVHTKIPYMTKYLKGTMIAFIVFGKNENIVQARFYDYQKNELTSIDRILII